MIPDWHTLVTNMVELGSSSMVVSVAEKVLRPVVIYLLLVFVLRRYGKRMLAQLNPFDFVVLLMLSNTVQNAIIGNDTSLVGGVIGAAALLAANSLVVRWYYRGPLFEHQVIASQDVCLIAGRQPQEAEMRRLHINVGDLTTRAHERGFDSLKEVDTAVLYPNGAVYMKGTSQDSARLEAILKSLDALRGDIASLRGGAQA